jgi:cytochrome c oxidase subunit I+III
VIATAGAFLFAASFLVMFYNLVTSLYSDRTVEESPWAYAAPTEWAVDSPPPEGNFPGTPVFTSGRLTFLTAETDGGVRVLDADGSETATDGGVHADAADLRAGHADHASWWPLLVALGGLVTIFGAGGLAAGYVVWPFVLAVPAFVAALAYFGARSDGRARIHDAYLGGAVALLGGLLAAFHLRHGLVDGLAGAGASFWTTLAGTTWGAAALAGFGYESFEVPEPTLNEAWPFEGITNTKLGMWVFLGSDIILFGALIGSYVFIRFQSGWQAWWHDAALPEAAHQVLPGLVNTYLLLASSFTVVLALAYARRGHRRGTIGFLALTFVGAAGFLVNKAYEWNEFINHEGWTHTSDVMGSTFFVTTGIHAAHVIIGMLITLFLIARAWQGGYWGDGEDAHTVEYFGLYWHFVDIVWLFLFPLFYIL